MKKIAVFCGASIGFNPIYKTEAENVGAYFSKNKIGLVYGAGKIGMMGALADELLRHNGEVIGIIPHWGTVINIHYERFRFPTKSGKNFHQF